MPTGKSNKRTGKKSPTTRGQKKKKSKGNTASAAVTYNRSSAALGRKVQRYRESERILTVNGSVEFAVVGQIPLNPGLTASFPWLSGHAKLYENYKVHSITYRYKNLKGSNTDGNIIMSFDYDVTDSPPTSAVAATQSTVWKDGAPWRIFELKVPSDGRMLFTREGPTAGDPKMSDMGMFYLSAEGCANETAHGYLEVEYDISFFNKQVNTGAVFADTIGEAACLLAPSAVYTSIYFYPIRNFMTNPSTNFETASAVDGPYTIYGMKINHIGIYRFDVTLAIDNNNATLDLEFAAIDIIRVPVGGGLKTTIFYLKDPYNINELFKEGIHRSVTFTYSITDADQIFAVRVHNSDASSCRIYENSSTMMMTYLGSDPTLSTSLTLSKLHSVSPTPTVCFPSGTDEKSESCSEVSSCAVLPSISLTESEMDLIERFRKVRSTSSTPSEPKSSPSSLPSFPER